MKKNSYPNFIKCPMTYTWDCMQMLNQFDMKQKKNNLTFFI